MIDTVQKVDPNLVGAQFMVKLSEVGRYFHNMRVIAALLLTFLMNPARSANQIPVNVNKSVELVSIVFRLAGAGEYNSAPADAPYVKRVDSWFGNHKSHEAVEYAKQIRVEDGISFDAVASFAVHLAPGKFHFKLPDDALMSSIDSRWKLDRAKKFAGLLKKFSRDASASKFFASEQGFYRQVEAEISKPLQAKPFVPWFEDLFGRSKGAKFSAIPGLLNGGSNYGVSVRFSNGASEQSPIFGVYQFGVNGLPIFTEENTGLIVHEFGHTFSNPLVEKYWADLEPSASKIFPYRQQILGWQAYSSAKAMMFESMVRALTVRFAQEQMTKEEAKRAQDSERIRGFIWTNDFALLIDKFRGDRKAYPTFEKFMPVVVRFFNNVAESMPERLAKLPRVIECSIKDASEVDPDTSLLKVKFDRKMAPSKWGIEGVPFSPWSDGTWGGRWSADQTEMTLPLALQPGKEYVLVIGNMRPDTLFSADGWALDPVLIKFKTR